MTSERKNLFKNTLSIKSGYHPISKEFSVRVVHPHRIRKRTFYTLKTEPKAPDIPGLKLTSNAGGGVLLTCDLPSQPPKNGKGTKYNNMECVSRGIAI